MLKLSKEEKGYIEGVKNKDIHMPPVDDKEYELRLASFTSRPNNEAYDAVKVARDAWVASAKAYDAAYEAWHVMPWTETVAEAKAYVAWGKAMETAAKAYEAFQTAWDAWAASSCTHEGFSEAADRLIDTYRGPEHNGNQKEEENVE